ncbi:MAG: response regulator transcription factor [Dehalococcoidia bacterium]|nr:response regulator transcription factor [Dehalococcoidia bacterium]
MLDAVTGSARIGGHKIRLLLVDDHRILRQGMRRLLDLDTGLEVVGEAESGYEALAQVRLCRPDIVLMDIRIPGLDGIETTRRLKQEYPKIGVIILTSYTGEYLPQAIEAGASGYLLKNVSYEELSRCIRAVKAGEVVVDRSLGPELFRQFAALSGGTKARLSQRELSVLRLLAAGRNTREIAAELFISETTLKRDLRSIYAKLNAHNRAEAIARGYEHKLL